MADYSRPAGAERFRFLGVKTNAPADAIPVGKYPYAQNVRTFQNETITSRPQIVQSQAAPGGGNNGAVLSLEPTNGVYKIGTKLLVGGTVVDTGYASGLGAAIMPFRPNASPNAYDYVFDDSKSSKVYVSANGTVTVQKAGIAEPQNAPDVCPDYFFRILFNTAAANWTVTGTAGAPADITRFTDTVGVAFADPASSPSVAAASKRISMEVGSSTIYQVGELVTTNGAPSITSVVQDVIPATSVSSKFVIKSIQYLSGNTGPCVIVTTEIGGSFGTPLFVKGDPSPQSVLTQVFLSSFKRGAILSMTGGVSEKSFILSSSLGPDGSICIETSTVSNHAAGEQISIVNTLVTDNTLNSAGQSLTSAGLAISSAIGGAGTGTLSQNVVVPLFGLPLRSVNDSTGALIDAIYLPRPDDFVHFSVNVSDLTQLSTTAPAIRIMFDVGDGSFTKDFYFFDVQPNALVSSVASTQTQLAATQISTQQQISRSVLRDVGSGDFETFQIAALNPDITVIDIPGTQFGSGGDTTATGTSAWSEITFPISSLTRVGTDNTKTLLNTNAIRIQVITSGAITFQLGSFWTGGGGQLDSGISMPYFYRVRPRSSITGAKGNPSPPSRYGVFARRQAVPVALPSAAYDSQIDTWDVFRFGGSTNSWRYVGSALSSASSFLDVLEEFSIQNAQLLDFENLEPFPSIGQPITATSATIVGNFMSATFPLATVAAGNSAIGTLSQLQNILPGTEVNVGNQVFTVFKRPVFSSSTGTTQTYIFRFFENAGAQTNPLVLIQEPNLAAQPSNNVWGPDANGVFFAVMAGISNNGGSLGLRSGLIQWTNPSNPDSASDKNTNDLCAPSEPLQNGALLGPTPCAASPKRWWRGYVQADGSYAWNEIPVGRGLAAQFGICSDGQFVYFVAEDGIYRHAGGGSESLTDTDLYNLFPHEGIFPKDITYLGQTIFAPEYKFSVTFRLNVINKFLYFDYMDTSQNYRTMVCDLRTGAWCPDVYSPNPVSIHAGSTSPASNDQVPGSAVRNQQLFLGDTTGAIYNEQSSPVPATGESVACVAVTREEMFGDLRANKQFGDAALDALAAGGSITITPVFFGSLFGTSTVISGNQISRPASPPTINILGQQLKRSMGLFLSWTDQGASTILYSWQLSYFTQPEDISNRITDWDNCGTESNKFIQGFTIEADSLNVAKNLQVRDGDNLAFHDFTSPAGTNQIKANGQQIITCSFNTPFIAHLVRVEPQDFTVWRLFKINWVYQPTPPSALTWTIQPTNFDLDGYIHAKEILFCYVSTQSVTLTITCFDGLSPSPITFPSTGGAVQKILVPLSPNKGLLFTLSASSTAPSQVYADACEILVKAWGSLGPYQRVKNLGAPHGDMALV